MSKSRGSARRGRRTAVVVVALAATVGAVVLGSAGTASAGNTIVCGGKVVPTNKKKVADDATYSIQCSQDIRAYSVISTKQFDFFGTETNVTPTVSQSATLQCEGTAPGFGFGCGVVDALQSSGCNAKTTANGKPNCNVAPPCGQTANGGSPVQNTPACLNELSAGNTISGQVSFVSSPCVGKKPKIWVTAASNPEVTSVAVANGQPAPDTSTLGAYSSEPFPLKVTGFSGKKCAHAIQAASKGK